MQIASQYCHKLRYAVLNRKTFFFIPLILCLWAFYASSGEAVVRSAHNSDLTCETNHGNRIRPKAFKGNLSLSRAPRLYETALLTLSLESLIDKPLKAKVRFVIPQGMFFISDNGAFVQNPALFQDISLAGKSTAQCSVAVTVVKTGNYTLQASVYIPSGRHSRTAQITQHFFAYLSVSDTQSTSNDIDEYSALLPFSFSEAVRVKPGAAKLAPPKAGLGMVVVRGTALYFDDNELRELPIRDLKVTLFDENNEFFDEVIATTYTNEQGEYYFSVKNIDREDNSKRDLYVIFSFENDALYIQDKNDRFYEFSSETVFDAQDGEWEFHLELDLQDTFRGLGVIHNTIMKAHDFLLNRVGWERDAIRIRWPANGRFSYYEMRWIGFDIDEVINIIRGDEWLSIAMYHEYGHAVMTSAYGNDPDKIPFGDYDIPHQLFTVSDRKFAMSEGWAEFMEAAVDDNALNVTGYINADIPNIESNRWWTGDVDGNGSNTHGEIVEGAVASVFWDITDTTASYDTTPSVDDDGISDMFRQLWEILTNDRPIDIIAVAKAWERRNFDSYDELELIYATHGILLRPNSPPTITITSPSEEGAVVDASYTITWVSNDKENDAYTVDLFFDTDNIPGGETEIKTMIPSGTTSFEWDTSKISDGRYYIYAIIRDTRAGENEDYSDGVLIVDHSPLSPPVVTSSTHPEQSRWYANNSPQFTLRTTPYNPKRQYSFILNGKPDTIPDTKLEKDIAENSLSFSNLPEGVWWLHIRARDNLGYWTDATNFRINIDVSKPSRVENVHWVNGKANQGGDSAPALIELAWNAADDNVSGVAKYHIQIYANPVGVKSPDISVDNLFLDITVDGNTLSKSFVMDKARTYFARVRAEDRAGLLSNWSSISDGVTVLRQHPWDVNRDNKVDIADLALLEMYFGEAELSSAGRGADVNGDGVIDILDLVLIGQHFGE